MRSCVFFAILFLCLYGHATENLRFFKSVDSPSTQLTVLEMDMGTQPVALLKLEGIKHNDAGKVFMFYGEKEKRFTPLNGATNMVLIDYNKKNLIAGTVKKVWTLAGLDKDITLEEVSAPATVTAESLKAEYNKAEGEGAGAYGTNDVAIAKAAESILNKSCGTTLNVKADTSSFKKIGVPTYKPVAIATGIAELCMDKDYQEVIKDFKNVSVYGTPHKEVQFDRKGTTLELGIPKDLQNTSRTIKKTLEKKL